MHNDEPTNVLDILCRTHSAKIAEAVQDGRDVTKVLLAAAVNTIDELQGALSRLLAAIPPDVRSTIDIDALIPDDDPGEAPTDVQKAALALLAAMLEGDPDDDTTVNLLCDVIDGLRRENEDLRAQLQQEARGATQ